MSDSTEPEDTTTITVTTQAELDAALQRTDLEEIIIDSATVSVYGSATVRASGSATVRAYDSATVRAYDSATVSAYDSATVSAYDSATVSAYDSATVSAYDSATVRAGSHVAVHRHSIRADVDGGVVIDVTDLNLDAPTIWCQHRGAEIIDGQAILYKATDEELTAGRDYGRPTVYTPGTTVTAEDWRDDDECGGGLHVSQSPHHAERYRNSVVARYLRVSAPVDSIRVLGNDKVKVPSLTVLAEVDIHARDLPVPAAQEG